MPYGDTNHNNLFITRDEVLRSDDINFFDDCQSIIIKPSYYSTIFCFFGERFTSPILTHVTLGPSLSEYCHECPFTFKKTVCNGNFVKYELLLLTLIPQLGQYFINTS